ncbi:argininosuccinate lyase [Tenacibaculum sp. MEBiC06402]|uniref:argininosuccinate lyase n=1 Tax=unclassified Tenacibaculum TaxID=2635139 RepID=UPI003B9C7E29
MKLWKKEFSLDKAIENFTIGNDREIDIHIAKYDVIASKAHAKMLASVGIISSEESEALIKELDLLLQQIENNEFIIEQDFEDVHSKIEFELTKKLGETGKKIHTARSRNDQVLVALQLYYKNELLTIIEQVKTLFNTLISLAEQYKDKLLPGYTHLQVAMPSSFGLWFSGYAETLLDDIELLSSSLKIVDQNPLGSAAGYGSSFPIDRVMTTEELEFATLKYNVIAAQMARGKNERIIASSLGYLGNTLSKFSMDICLYMSQNFGFITFPDELTTGSSIMPHKKNPDVFELVRGKCNQIQSLQTEMLLLTNNLPSGYHRDYQLLKENMIKAFENMKTILGIFNYSINQVIVKDIDMYDDKYKYLYTVDNINTLVTNGMSFRDAYLKISSEVENGTYVPDASKDHSHVGSIHNLSLDKIREKLAAKF